ELFTVRYMGTGMAGAVSLPQLELARRFKKPIRWKPDRSSFTPVRLEQGPAWKERGCRSRPPPGHEPAPTSARMREHWRGRYHATQEPQLPVCLKLTSPDFQSRSDTPRLTDRCKKCSKTWLSTKVRDYARRP